MPRSAMSLWLAAAVVAAVGAALSPVVSADPVVQTTCGPVLGHAENDLTVFRGIPYGAPPVRELRWKPPLPSVCWSGVFNASSDGNSCIQLGNPSAPHPSEDCLYLNVFTKQLTPSGKVTEKKPVLFWIHGGGLNEGWSGSYGPVEDIIDFSNGSFVLVGINYRLNALGFVAIKELREHDPRGVAGNYGFLDQQLAMKWVQDNIAAFGGDPTRVTVIGQSSGCTSIMAHLASPSAVGLFQGAICLSGSPNITMNVADKEAQDREHWLAHTPCASAQDVYTCIMNMDPEVAMRALAPPYNYWSPQDDYPSRESGIHWYGLVYVDGVTVAKPYPEALRQGLVDVPVIFQTLQAEMDGVPNMAVESWSTADLQNFWNKNFLPWGADTGSRVLSKYQQFVDIAPAMAYYAVDADTASTCGLLSTSIQAGLGFKSPVYIGEVLWGPSKHIIMGPNTYRAWPYHSWDFGIATNTCPSSFTPGPRDLELRDLIVRQWTSFITNLRVDPSFNWQPINNVAGFPEHYVHSLITTNGTASAVDWKSDICNFWSSIGVDERFWWVN